jgi:DNA adenine methylase
VTVRNRQGRIVALVEIVSPGNKGSDSELCAFVEKTSDSIQAGIHVPWIVLFSPHRARSAGATQFARPRYFRGSSRPTILCGFTPCDAQLRPAVKWHGGKAYLARRIIKHFGPHGMYFEPFAGGLSVLLNKRPADIEVANDIDPGLTRFYPTLQDLPSALLERLAAVRYSLERFDRALLGVPSDALDAAVRFLIRNRMSRGGMGRSFARSDRLRGGQPGDLNAWETSLAQLPIVADRLRQVILLNAPAVDVIQEHDAPHTIHYCDPPYLHSTRTARKTYAHEMTEDEHAELFEVLAVCRGAVLLSGYPSPLYDSHLAGWKRVAFDMPNHAGQGRCKQRRTEVLWVKPARD